MIETLPPALARYIDGLRSRDVEKIAGAVGDDLRFIGASRTLTKPEFLSMLRALYAGFPDWSYARGAPERHGDAIAIPWRQGGTHTGTFALPGMAPIPPTGRTVRIPEQRFFYRVDADRIVEIRPDPVPGGAPWGILEQIGVAAPPL